MRATEGEALVPSRCYMTLLVLDFKAWEEFAQRRG